MTRQPSPQPGLDHWPQPIHGTRLNQNSTNFEIRDFSVDDLPEFNSTPKVMKNSMRKITLFLSLIGFVAALVVPAEAGRTGGSTIIIIPPTPKPVVSRF